MNDSKDNWLVAQGQLGLNCLNAAERTALVEANDQMLGFVVLQCRITAVSSVRGEDFIFCVGGRFLVELALFSIVMQM